MAGVAAAGAPSPAFGWASVREGLRAWFTSLPVAADEPAAPHHGAEGGPSTAAAAVRHNRRTLPARWAALISWHDVYVCDLAEKPEDEPLPASLAALPYILFVGGGAGLDQRGAPLGLCRGVDAASVAPSALVLWCQRCDPAGAHWCFLSTGDGKDHGDHGDHGDDAASDASAINTAHGLATLHHGAVGGLSTAILEATLASPDAFCELGALAPAAPGRAGTSLRPSMPGAPSGVAALLDALLELYELVVYEGVVPGSREYVRRCAALHRRHFDLETPQGRARDAAGLGALPFLLYTQPQLEPLVHAALGRLLLFRFTHVFAGEARVARACRLLRAGANEGDVSANEDGERPIFFTSVESAHASGRVCARTGAPLPDGDGADATTTSPELLDAVLASAGFSAAGASADAVEQARARCALSLRAARQRLERAVAARGPAPPARHYYVVSVRRDAYDLWGGGGAGFDQRGGGAGFDQRGATSSAPVAFFGYAFAHYRELPVCLARRVQTLLLTALAALRQGAYVASPHLAPNADDFARLGTAPGRDTAELVERLLARVEQARAPQRAGAGAGAGAKTLAPTPASVYATAALRRDAAALVTGAYAAFARRVLAPYGLPGQLRMPRFFYEGELVPCAAAASERFYEVQRRLAGEQRVRTQPVPAGVETSARALLEHAWAAMPPCQAVVVGRALTADLAPPAHPKYDARVRLALFLFYGGWSFGRALEAWRHLFVNKCGHARRGAEDFARYSEYARILEGLYSMYRGDIDAQCAAAVDGAVLTPPGAAAPTTAAATAAGTLGGPSTAAPRATQQGVLAGRRDMVLDAPGPRGTPARQHGGGAGDPQRGGAGDPQRGGHGPASCRRMCESGACPMAQYDTLQRGAAPGTASVAADTQEWRAMFAYVPDIEDIGGAAQVVAPNDAVPGQWPGDGGGVVPWHAPLDDRDIVAGGGGARLGAAPKAVARAQTRCLRYYKALHRGWPGDTGPIVHPVSYYTRALGYAAALAAPQ